MPAVRGVFVLLLALLGARTAPGATLTVYAAGDIAECHGPARNSAAAATARLIPHGATTLLLGDIAYPGADRGTLERCYAPTWGARAGEVHPVPGNHDYIGGEARDFRDYFGLPASGPLRYRVALGEWWLFGLDSNLNGAALAEELAWLQAELDALPDDGRCIMAAWHHAAWSTGLHDGDGARMRAFWRVLARAGADVVLAGHEHFYESLPPLDETGAPSAAGMREFVVGTGGARLTDVSLSPWRHRAYARRHGVLRLDLAAGSFRWRFLDVSGHVLDEGTAACHARESRAPHSR